MTLEDQLLLLKNAAISLGETVQDVSIIPGAWCLVYPGYKEVFWIAENEDGERGIFKLKLDQ